MVSLSGVGAAIWWVGALVAAACAVPCAVAKKDAWLTFDAIAAWLAAFAMFAIGWWLQGCIMWTIGAAAATVRFARTPWWSAAAAGGTR